MNEPTLILPQPTLKGNPNRKGPMSITDEHMVSERIRNTQERNTQMKEYENKLIKALAKRERIIAKIPKLKISNKSQSKEIARLNIKLSEVNKTIEIIQEQSGLTMRNIKHGTRLQKFMNAMKIKLKKIVKVIKQIYKDHKVVVITAGVTLLSWIGKFIINKFIPI